MRWTVLALLLAVDLGAPFGAASASGEPTPAGTIEVELEVEAGGEGSVVAHIVDPGNEQQTVSLAERGGNRFGGFVELEPGDFVVVFEWLPADGPAVQSRPVTLTELGLDPALFGGGAIDEPRARGEDLPPTTRRWGWATLALGAAALALLAVWALGDYAKRAGEGEPPASPTEEPSAAEKAPSPAEPD